MPALGKFAFFSIIGFIISLTLLIMFGRILNKLNESSCYTHSPDDDLKSAHRWAAWGVGIAAASTALFLLGIILMFI